MTTISITITESEFQVVSGIPKTISLSTNIPATIFYTLDGTDPNTSSTIYVGGNITLPTNQPSVVFKAFATDGYVTCPIISTTYSPNIAEARLPHDEVLNQPSAKKEGAIGFPGPTVPAVFGTFAPKEEIVDRPDRPNVDTGDFDSTGTSVKVTDKELTEYDLIFSETNSIGETGRGIGTLPSKTTIIPESPNTPDIRSDASSAFFNPRARVIIQDSSKPPFDDNVQQLNRAFFSLENSEVVRDGALLQNTGIDTLASTGSFLKAHWNPRTNESTYYYFDSATLRWIISTEKFTPKSPRDSGLINVVFASRGPGSKYVFKWLPFTLRRLV